MPQFFFNKRLIFLLIAFILLVTLIGFSIHDRKNISKPEQFLNDIVGFGQSIVSVPAHKVGDFFGSIEDVKNTYTENKKLKARLDQIPELNVQVSSLQKENADLNAQLNKKDEDDINQYNTIQATVISRNPDRWYENIVINKGSSSGVSTGMAIYTAQGLIGRVISTDTFYSTVELLSAPNPKNRVSASIQLVSKKKVTNVYGLIQGYDTETSTLKFTDIPSDKVVKKGSKVGTSGLGAFPKGLLIGKVLKVEPAADGLTQTAYVKPYADFYDLENVMVIKASNARTDYLKDNGGKQ